MLSILLLIVTFSLSAAESSLPSPSLENALSPIKHDNQSLMDTLIRTPQLIGQLNFGDVQNGYEFAWKEYHMPPEISRIISAITHVTSCIYPSDVSINVVSELEKQEEKYRSTLETTSTIAVVKDLQAHLFARLAQAYIPHNLEKACIYTCEGLKVHFDRDQSKIVLDPALAYLLAHQLQHNDHLRPIIHNALPEEHRYLIGQSLVMAKPTTAALVAQAITTTPETFTDVDRAFLSWLKRYYKNDPSKLPEIIAPEVFDKLLLACENPNLNLQRFIVPLLKTQYVRTHSAQRGELAFKLYLLTHENDKQNEDAITYLIDAINNSQKGTRDTADIYGIAYNEAIDLWNENRELAHLLIQALATQGYSHACDFICSELDNIITYENQIASNLLYAAMQGNTPTVQKYVIDNFHFIRTECPTLISPLKKYLQQISSVDNPEIRLKAKFMDSILNAEIDDSIKELETFTQTLTKRQMNPLQEQAFDEAHRCLADLYQVKVNEFVGKSLDVSIALKRGAATTAGKAFKKLHEMSAQRAQKSIAIASRSKNPIIQIRTLLTQCMHKSTNMLLERLQGKSTKLNAQDKQQLTENNKNILSLVTRLQQTPASDEYAVFGMRNAQITKTHLIIEAFHFLANIEEKQLNNIAAYHSHICQAFNEDPTDPRNLKLIEDIVASACKENNPLAFKQTEMLLQALTISHPDQVRLYMHQATLARAQKDTPRAQTYYCKAGELGSAEAWYKAATIAEMLLNLQSAQEYYANALEIDPRNSTYKLSLDTAAFRPGLRAWKEHKDFKQAIAYWQPLEHTNHLIAFRLGLFKLYGDGGIYSPEDAHQYFMRAKSLITPEERANNTELAGMYEKYSYFEHLSFYQFHKSDLLEEIEKELLEFTARQDISNILKQEAYIALAQQRTFIADDLEAQVNDSATSIDTEQSKAIKEHRTMAQLFLKNATLLEHAQYTPRLKHLFACAVTPTTNVLDSNDVQNLRTIYSDVIERGPADNYFVQMAQTIVQNIDNYLSNETEQSIEN